MSDLLGALNISEAAAERTYVNTLGQRQVFDEVQKLMARYNAELDVIKRLFIERSTEDRKFRYYLPGGGRLQRRGGDGRSGAVKAGGSWDVGFPLEDFGAEFSEGNDVVMAYMTAAQLDRHLKTVFVQDTNTVRFEILYALFHNVARTFKDEIWGDITVQPLASGDSTVYPQVLGSETQTTDNHYLESGYLAAAISDTNNPFLTLRDELEEHFGAPTGGSNIVVFHNQAQTAIIESLTNFEEVFDSRVQPGANENTLMNLPASMPGRVIGRTDSCWNVEWRWMPANYLVALHLDAPPPLIERIDIAESGLGSGFQLVAKDGEFPLESALYRHRFGLGVGSRLSAVVMELGNGGTYTIPTAYA